MVSCRRIANKIPTVATITSMFSHTHSLEVNTITIERMAMNGIECVPPYEEKVIEGAKTFADLLHGEEKSKEETGQTSSLTTTSMMGMEILELLFVSWSASVH